MSAEYFLDSVRVREAIDKLAATWRSKREPWNSKVDAFQAVLELVTDRAIPAEPRNAPPQYAPETKTATKGRAADPIKQAKNVEGPFDSKEQAGIEFDPFNDPLEPVDEPPQESQSARYERFKAVLKERISQGTGNAIAVWVDDDFPADLAPRMVEELGGWAINPDGQGILPMAAVSRVAGGGPSSGWRIRLLRR
jgi:hypothetical protein